MNNLILNVYEMTCLYSISETEGFGKDIYIYIGTSADNVIIEDDFGDIIDNKKLANRQMNKEKII